MEELSKVNIKCNKFVNGRDVSRIESGTQVKAMLSSSDIFAARFGGETKRGGYYPIPLCSLGRIGKSFYYLGRRFKQLTVRINDAMPNFGKNISIGRLSKKRPECGTSCE
jgi:hypothetical protein